MFRVFVVALLAVSLCACTTLHPVTAPFPSAAAQLEAGDEVRIRTRAGKTYELEIRSVSETALVGRDGSGKSWKVPFAQIESMEARQLSAAKTGGLSLLTVVLILGALFVVGAKAFGDGLEDSFGGD